jgi:hypothetical protein
MVSSCSATFFGDFVNELDQCPLNRAILLLGFRRLILWLTD